MRPEHQALSWGDPNSDPLADIQLAKQNAFSRSGVKITRLIFGANAWAAFAANAKVDLKNQMDRNFGGLTTEVTRLYDAYEGQEYMGRIAGLNNAGLIEAWIDTSKTDEQDGEVGVVGFEIPFNRHFYVFKPPRPLDEIDRDLKACTDRIKQMIEGLSA